MAFTTQTFEWYNTELDAIFWGKRTLFKGLSIDQTDYQWPVHPVIRLDMKVAAQPNLEDAKTGLLSALRNCASRYQLDIDERLPEDQLKELIRRLHQKTNPNVVVLTGKAVHAIGIGVDCDRKVISDWRIDEI